MKRSLAERFWALVDKNGPQHPTRPDLGQCWLWKGGLRKDGYGYIYDEQHVFQRAHRIAWHLTHGAIPVGKFILHSCDNPPCVNPYHTYPGDQKQNTTDTVARGRTCKGERNAMARLTPEAVREIMATYPRTRRRGPRAPQEWELIQKMAEKFGVSTNSLSRIIRGGRWKHITCSSHARA